MILHRRKKLWKHLKLITVVNAPWNFFVFSYEIIFICLNIAPFVSPIKCQCCPHMETSQLICFANKLTGFYMRATLAFTGLSVRSQKHARIRNVTSTESYFENFLHEIHRIFAETRRKLMPEVSVYCDLYR